MHSENNRAIYRRLLVLGLLSMCIVYFGYSEVEKVKAAACMQDCDAYWAMCNDGCESACGENSNDTVCNACLSSCSADWNDCLEHSEFCETGTVGYNAICTLGYDLHCPIIGGSANCSYPSAHYGFYEICQHTTGPCVSCPEHNFCYGSGGLPPCGY